MQLEKLTSLVKKAQFIRAFEQALACAADDGEIPGLIHLSNGAELLEVAVIGALDVLTDQVAGSHRSHGIALALGVDPYAVACEILGRKGGLSEGLGGTQHLVAPETGLLGSNGIVGGQVPLAAGAALSAKVRGTGGIAVAFFGDGAANQGAVLETLNLSVVLKLPILFVLENNGLGQSTASSYAAGGVSLLARARAFGLAAEHVDGTDVEESSKAAERLTTWVRDTGSPAFLEASVPRLAGHFHGDTESYKSDAKDHSDPLDRAMALLKNHKVPAGLIEDIQNRAKQEANAIVAKATKAPDISDKVLQAWFEEGRS